jgi:carbon-monoxide dehydrogenase medium subunit
MAVAAPFVLERPLSVEDAVALLAEHGENARIMAGGQSLTPLMTLGLAIPEVVISVDRCLGLDHLELDAASLRIGARVTTAQLSYDAGVSRQFPLLATAASHVGSPHVRNFGTVVGNVCHADPGSDLIPALLCYDTSVLLRSTGMQRQVPLDDFIAGPFSTTADESEMAVGLDIDVSPDSGWHHGYRKLVKRSGDLAMAICATNLQVETGRVVRACVAIGGAVSRAQRLPAMEAQLVGSEVVDAAEVAYRADWSLDAGLSLMPEIHAPADYLRSMLPRFIASTVQRTIEGCHRDE